MAAVVIIVLLIVFLLSQREENNALKERERARKWQEEGERERAEMRDRKENETRSQKQDALEKVNFDLRFRRDLLTDSQRYSPREYRSAARHFYRNSRNKFLLQRRFRLRFHQELETCAEICRRGGEMPPPSQLFLMARGRMYRRGLFEAS